MCKKPICETNEAKCEECQFLRLDEHNEWRCKVESYGTDKKADTKPEQDEKK